jgi:hypothetical protein
MSTFTWYLQGTTNTEIAETDILQFAGMGFNSTIIVGDYNKSTHVKTSAGADKSSANTPNNNRYVSSNQVSINEGANQSLSTVINSKATLLIKIEDLATFQVEDAIFFVYKGAVATPPADLDFQVAEVGDTDFTQALGKGDALALDDKTVASTEQNYYIVASLSPEDFGTRTGTMRFEGVLI